MLQEIQRLGGIEAAAKYCQSDRGEGFLKYFFQSFLTKADLNGNTRVGIIVHYIGNTEYWIWWPLEHRITVSTRQLSMVFKKEPVCYTYEQDVPEEDEYKLSIEEERSLLKYIPKAEHKKPYYAKLEASLKEKSEKRKPVATKTEASSAASPKEVETTKMVTTENINIDAEILEKARKYDAMSAELTDIGMKYGFMQDGSCVIAKNEKALIKRGRNRRREDLFIDTN